MAGRVLKTLTCLLIFAEGTPASAPQGSLYRAPGETTYDYVVVGGGTAGLTVASRLAQRGNFTIGIIEAGSIFDQESGNHSIVPGYDYHGFGGPLGPFNPLSDWGFHTLPSAETANRSVLYARGKGLGGSSARNYLVYQRPSKGSMDQWAAAVSDKAWSWENVTGYYQRSSSLHEPDMRHRGGNSTPLYDVEAFANGPINVG
jgi:choline dehydrogenase